MVLIPLGIVRGVALVMAVQEIWSGLIPLLLVSAYLFQITFYVIEGENPASGAFIF